jgi:hypothetical protein
VDGISIEAMRRQLESGVKAMEAGIAARDAVIEARKPWLVPFVEAIRREWVE